MKIEIVHRGEDYYGVEINGKYIEISIIEGEVIKDLLKVVKKIIKNN